MKKISLKHEYYLPAFAVSSLLFEVDGASTCSVVSETEEIVL